MTTDAPIAHQADGFPIDEYTPYGYLNLVGHTRRLTPRGVMRSHGVGMRWHFPALAAAYGGRSERYRAGLRLVDADPVQTSVPYHSSNVLRFEGLGPGGDSVATWFMINDDCLCLRIQGPAAERPVLAADYYRVVSADGEWGESGLVGRCDDDDLVLQSFEDGDAFVVRAVGGTLTATFADDAQGPVTVLGTHQELVQLTADLRVLGGGDTVWVMMARGATVASALQQFPIATELDTALTARQAGDDAFWRQSPVLSGDWPEHWRRGLVYDLETLRMMIKDPVGIYAHKWDAMQIQAPRTVLGEAAMDALALSWADPELAATLLLGTFADAPMPNVPCSREDGTFNMVSADGTVCGTGPQWGYPFLAAARIAALQEDDQWLRAIYPHLGRYLDWWLAQRRDADGWLVHACSWESGQDLSPRFGEQPLGGGHPTWQLRPVDLHAAAAHAAVVLADFAASVAPADVAHWAEVSSDLSERTRALWQEGRFADVDGATGRATDVEDVMLLAPLALGVAADDQKRHLQTTLDAVAAADLVWPMFVWTPVLAAQRSGRFDIASDVASVIIDRAYRFWDARDYDGSGTMPGIACEYWPLHGRCGGEGYGWGAFSVELLLDAVIGLRVEADHVDVRPMLPPEFRRTGDSYRLDITTHGVRRHLVLEPQDDDRVRVRGLGAEEAIVWGQVLHRSLDELS